MIVKCENGVVIEAKESPYYFVVTVDKRTWYWNKDTGKFSGTSKKVSKD
jgi:hypothetical protein